MVKSSNAWSWALHRHSGEKMARIIQKRTVLIKITKIINKRTPSYYKKKSVVERYLKSYY